MVVAAERRYERSRNRARRGAVIDARERRECGRGVYGGPGCIERRAQLGVEACGSCDGGLGIELGVAREQHVQRERALRARRPLRGRANQGG